MTPRSSYRGWLVLGGGFVLMAVGYGMRNTFTVFYPAIVEDFGWTRGSTALMFSVALLSYGFVAPLAGGLVDRFNPKIVLATGGAIMGGGIALCSLATQPWHFYLVYGVMVAVGLSLTGMTPVSTITADWFPTRRAMVFGLLSAGFGVSLVTAPLYQFLISTFGWQTAYVIIGGSAAAIVVPIVLLFIKRNRELADTGRAGATARAELDGGMPIGTMSAACDWTARAALKTGTFKLFLVISFCVMGVAQQFMIAHQVYIMQDAGYAPMTAATVFTGFGGGLAVGTVLSFLSDRFGRTLIFVGGCLLVVAGTVLILVFPGGGSLVVPTIFTISTGFGLGITPPTCFAAAADRFHGRNYGSIQGTLILACSLGGALGPWLGGFLHDITGNYQLGLMIVVAFLLVAAALMWIINRRQGRQPVQA